MVKLLYSLKYLNMQVCPFAASIQCDYRKIPRPNNIMSILKKGSATFYGSSATLNLTEGDIFFIPYGEKYISKWQGDSEGYCLSVFFNFEPSANPFSEKDIKMQKIFNDKEDRLFDFVKNADTISSLDAVKSFYDLCLKVFPKLVYSEKISNTAIKDALSYIEMNFDKPLSIETLADLCHLSKSRFHHLFKQTVGETPITYKNRIAINNAIVLLQQGQLSTAEISEKCGFSSTEYFRYIFKKIVGKPPKKYLTQPLI